MKNRFNEMRYLLFVLLLILPVFAGAQTRVYVTQDQPQQIRQFRGGVDALNYFRLPVQGGHSIPAGDSLWFVRVNPGDGNIYMWDGLTWGCMTCGGSGIVDSNLFVTITRLIDSLIRVQQTLDDSTAALRLLIASGSADSALFATLYRLDTTRAGLDMRIALKQNQLNGTGFVKISGTTISYDNSTYTPTGRTITINGSTQDLSANRTWTIPGVDTTSLSNRIDGKLNTSDTATMLGGYLRKGDTASLSNRINSKQNLITLTTTGTSGAATFNQSTGDLNIPNYANTTYTGSTSIVLTSGSFQRAALTGDVTASANSNATTIANNVVTNAKAADMAVNTIKGRITAGTGDPQDLTATQVRTIINVADGAEVNVNADWNAASGDAQILNKPTIPDVSGLATQQGLDDSMVIVRDSISALRADIGSGGGGGLDTTTGDARYLKLGGNAIGAPVVVGTNDLQNVHIIVNNSPYIEAGDGGLTFGGASQLSLRSFGNRIMHNAVDRHQWTVNDNTAFNMVFSSSGLGVGLPNNTTSSATLQVVGNTLLEGTSPTTGYVARFENSEGTVVAQFNNNNTVEFNSLSGTGTRMVVADDGGTLSTQAIPSVGSVTSVGISVPTGFSVSGSPVTSSGTIGITYAAGYQGYTTTEANKLSGIETGADVTDATNVAAAGAVMDGDFSANGVMTRTAAGTYTSRTITGTTNQITVTNGNGQSGNPTISLPTAVTDNLTLASTALQSVVAGTNVTIDNTDPQNPVINATGGGSIDTTSLSNRIDQKVTKGGDNVTDLTVGGNSTFNIQTAGVNRIRSRTNFISLILPTAIGYDGPLSAGNLLQVRGLSSSTGTIAIFENLSGTDALSIYNDLNVRVHNLAGTGTRVVAANADGDLGASTISDLLNTAINNQTGTTYTLTSTDFDNKTIVVATNANPITVTIPPGIAAGRSVLVEQGGAGQITFAPGSGVTLQSYQSALTTAGTNVGITILSKGSDTYVLYGILE